MAKGYTSILFFKSWIRSLISIGQLGTVFSANSVYIHTKSNNASSLKGLSSISMLFLYAIINI